MPFFAQIVKTCFLLVCFCPQAPIEEAGPSRLAERRFDVKHEFFPLFYFRSIQELLDPCFLDFIIIINETASEKTHTTTQQSSNIQKTSEILYVQMNRDQNPYSLLQIGDYTPLLHQVYNVEYAIIIWIPINQPVE